MDERELELAESRQQAELAASLAAIPRYEGVSATHCDDCGDEIPEGRRQAVPGTRQCTECAGRKFLNPLQVRSNSECIK